MGTKEAKYDFIGEFHQGVAIVVKNGKFGAILQGGHEIIGPSYDYISPFKEGYADAIKNGIYFVLNLSGKMCVKDGSDYIEIPNKYQQARDFKDGLCCVCHDDKWGAIDKNGHEVIPTQYDYLSDFIKGVAIYRISGRDCIGRHKYLFGFLNTNREVFPAVYDSIWVDDTTGYIHTRYINSLIVDDEKRIYNHPKRLDCNGRFVAKYNFEYITLNGKYDYVEDYVDEIAVAKKKGLWGAIDKNENKIIPFKYNFLNRLDINTFIGYLENGKKEFDVKFVKTNGNVSGSIKNIRNIIPLDDGICLFCINKRDGWNSIVKYGIVNKKGKVLLNAEYDDIQKISDILYKVICSKKEGLLYGIVNKEGKVLLNAEYDDIQKISDILYKVICSKKEGLFNTQKGWILPCKFDCLSFRNDYISVHIRNLGDFRFNLLGNCFVFNEGNIVELPKRCFVGRDFVDGYAPVCLGEKWGVINTSFRTVVKAQYDNIQNLGNGVFKISQKKGFSDWEHGLYKIGRGEVLTPKYKQVEKLTSTLFISRDERKYYRFGVVDITGKLIFKTKYNITSLLNDNWLVTTDNNGLRGIINLQTKKECAPSFDEIDAFEDGILVARREERTFYLNNEVKKVVKKSGKWEVIPDDIYWIGEFHDGIAEVLIDKDAPSGIFLDESGHLVLLNGKQRITLPPLTTYAYPFDDGANLAIIKYGNVAGLINRKGEIICTPQYSKIERYHESSTTFLCHDNEGKCGLIRLNDTTNSMDNIIECRYNAISNVKEDDDYSDEDNGTLTELFQLEQDGKIGVADNEGKILVSCEYSKVLLHERRWIKLYKEKQNAFSNEELQQYRWRLDNDYLVGLADIQGYIIVLPKYDYIQYLGGNLFSVRQGNYIKGKWGVLQSDGKMLTPLIFEEIDIFDGTCISVKYKGHQGYVNADGVLAVKDEEGNYIPITTTCDFVFDYDGKKAIALYKDYQGYVNKNGKILIKKDIYEYDYELDETNKRSIFLILPQQYEWGFDFIDNYAKVIKGGKYGIVFCDFKVSIDSLCRCEEYKEGVGFVTEFKEIVQPLYDDIEIIHKKIDCLYSPYDLYFKEKLLETKQITIFICTLGEMQYVCDSNGTIVYKSPCVTNRQKDLKIVQKNNYYGIVNSQENIIIPCLYDSVYIEQASGIIITNFGYMNEYGKHIVYINDDNLLLSSKYRRIDEFINGVAIVDMVIDKKLKYGLVNSQGEEILPPIYSFIKRLSNGMFKCGLNGRVGILNESGKYIIPNQFLFVRDFENGLSLIAKSVDGTYTKGSIREYSYMDWEGNIILSSCSYISKQSEGLSVVCRKGEWGFFNIIERKITKVEGASYVGLLHDDLAMAKFGGTCVIGGLWGFVNRNGEIVINPKYDYVFNFSEGIAAVKVGDKYGFIDTIGVLIVPCEYDEVVSSFENGEGKLVKGGRMYVFNRSGEMVSDYLYREDEYDYRADNPPYDKPYYTDNFDMDNNQ